MSRRELTLINRRGLHARAATKLVKCCQPFDARVSVEYRGRTAQADNIMSLLMLAAPCGSVLTLEAEGPEAEKALDALTELFEARFDESS
jgi:phosphocarrier protein NPr